MKSTLVFIANSCTLFETLNLLMTQYINDKCYLAGWYKNVGAGKR